MSARRMDEQSWENHALRRLPSVDEMDYVMHNPANAHDSSAPRLHSSLQQPQQPQQQYHGQSQSQSQSPGQNQHYSHYPHPSQPPPPPPVGIGMGNMSMGGMGMGPVMVPTALGMGCPFASQRVDHGSSLPNSNSTNPPPPPGIMSTGRNSLPPQPPAHPQTQSQQLPHPTNAPSHSHSHSHSQTHIHSPPYDPVHPSGHHSHLYNNWYSQQPPQQPQLPPALTLPHPSQWSQPPPHSNSSRPNLFAHPQLPSLAPLESYGPAGYGVVDAVPPFGGHAHNHPYAQQISDPFGPFAWSSYQRAPSNPNRAPESAARYARHHHPPPTNQPSSSSSAVPVAQSSPRSLPNPSTLTNPPTVRAPSPRGPPRSYATSASPMSSPSASERASPPTVAPPPVEAQSPARAPSHPRQHSHGRQTSAPTFNIPSSHGPAARAMRRQRHEQSGGVGDLAEARGGHVAVPTQRDDPVRLTVGISSSSAATRPSSSRRRRQSPTAPVDGMDFSDEDDHNESDVSDDHDLDREDVWYPYREPTEERVRAQQLLRGAITNKRVASRSAISSLQSVAISSLPESERMCVICYNEFGVENPEGINEAPLRLPKCQHVFGDYCIKKWFEESDSCPYCRDKVPSEPLMRLNARTVRSFLGPEGSLGPHANVFRSELLRAYGDRSEIVSLAARQAWMPSNPGRRSPPEDLTGRTRRTRPRHGSIRGPGPTPTNGHGSYTVGTSPFGTRIHPRPSSFAGPNAPHGLSSTPPVAVVPADPVASTPNDASTALQRQSPPPPPPEPLPWQSSGSVSRNDPLENSQHRPYVPPYHRGSRNPGTSLAGGARGPAAIPHFTPLDDAAAMSDARAALDPASRLGPWGPTVTGAQQQQQQQRQQRQQQPDFTSPLISPNQIGQTHTAPVPSAGETPATSRPFAPTSAPNAFMQQLPPLPGLDNVQYVVGPAPTATHATSWAHY